MTRHLPLLRRPALAVIFIAAMFGSVFSQNLPPPSNPEILPAFNLLAERKNDEARKLLKKIVEANEIDAEAWYYLGIAYIQLHDFKKATEAFQKTITLQPDMAAEVHARFGYALVLRNVLEGAEEEARKALSEDPKKVLALYTMGLVNLRKQARDEALKNADAIISVAPDFANAYLLKSQASMILAAAGSSSTPDEQRRNQRLRYREAAAPLDSYVKLLTDAKEVEFWRQQLETLEFYASDASAEVYTGRDVTGKARLISKPEPSYSENARADGIEGTVVLRCVFAEDGTVKHILVLRYLPGGLTETAIEAARKIKFIPGKINDKPVSMFMQLEYNFNLY